MEKKPEFHGSDLEKIASYYHMRKEDIICYSANVNPSDVRKGKEPACRQSGCHHPLS